MLPDESLLVSTAIMALHHRPPNGRMHLRERFRFSFGLEKADDLIQLRLRRKVARFPLVRLQ